MTIIIFLVILAVLILVHEFGHFITAKKSGVRVDEFGLGFPPRLLKFKKGETIYSLNIIPFGGFVKILGENPISTPEEITEEEKKRSLEFKPIPIKALVMAAGVILNIVLAWFLISISFMAGMPTSTQAVPEGAVVENAKIVVLSVKDGSPAEESGLKTGDAIVGLSTGTDLLNEGVTLDGVQEFIAGHGGQEIEFNYIRGDENKAVSIKPEEGIISGRPAIGISMDEIGMVRLSPISAFYEGAKTTGSLTYFTAIGIFSFLKEAVLGQADFSQIAGPVGIVSIVGDAAEFGFIYILGFAAFLSINLAIINLIPFPALDGGRLLFLLIEWIKRSPINPKIANTVNAAGFVLLIILMLLITYNDVIKLF